MSEQRIHINIPAVEQYASYLRRTAGEINKKQVSLINVVKEVGQYWRDDDYEHFKSEIVPIIRELTTFQKECIAEAARLEEIAKAASRVRYS